MITHGDSLEVLKTLEPNSVDACVTDPPYGWRFMGKAWDMPDIEKMAKAATGKEPRLCSDGKWRKPRENCKSIAAGKYDESTKANITFQQWTEAWAREVFRVLKPGGYALIFCGPRTYHRMACGVEDAGFEIRDQLQWLFGSGFPKSHNLGNGFGTALKPANEPIVLARKPLSEKTVAKNVEKWGCGALNIDGCRIGFASDRDKNQTRVPNGKFTGSNNNRETLGRNGDIFEPSNGRWPANLLLDEEAAKMLDEQSGLSKEPLRVGWVDKSIWGSSKKSFKGVRGHGDSGGASRFFYCAKSSKRDRGEGNGHPTVKPIKLMEYLCCLITPPNGTIIDPFMGSGTTGVAAKRLDFNFIGIEREAEYVEIAKRRIDQDNEKEALDQ